MKLRLAAAIFTVLPLLAGQAGAVENPMVLRVGDGTLDGAYLEPYNNAWFYSVKFNDGREFPEGIWSDHMQWTTLDGRQVLLRVQGTSFITGASNVIRNIFDPKTLAPLVTETHNIDGTIFRRTFSGAHVTSVTLANAKDPKTPDAADFPEAVYDFNGGMYGILLASLPLKEGLKGTLPAIADDGRLSHEPFEVLHQEEVDAGAHGKIKAWVVDSARPGNYTMRFWLTKKPPYIIRLVMTDEAHARTLTWDMI